MAKRARQGARVLSLEEKLAAIGVMAGTRRLTQHDIDSVDIEATLADIVVALAADEAALRWLGPILAWVREHGSSVIVEKLAKILRRRESEGAAVDYTALLARYAVGEGHKRWQTLLTLAPKTPRIVGPADLAPSLLKLRGEEPWARDVGFLVARGAFDVQGKWTLSRSALAKLNRQYRNRLVYGPQWRADIITVIERGAKTPSKASRASGASYEPCHRVFQELEAAGMLPKGPRSA